MHRTVANAKFLLRQGWQSYVIVHSVTRSVYLSRITHEYINGHRPNMVDMGKSWPARNG